jgi:hypothetical protein
MMSSTTWARLVLSPAMLHSVSSVMSCCRVARHCSGDNRVVHSADVTLQSHCNCLSACLAGIDCAVYPHVLQTHAGSDV